MAFFTATTLAVASIGMSAVSAYGQAKARRRQAAYNRDVAETNEQIAIDNAIDVVDRGRVATFDQRRAVAASLSDVDAATAASGVAIEGGGSTYSDLVTSMNVAGELDVLRLQNNIAREERRALVQASNYEAQAGQFELQRRSINPLRSGLTAGFSSAMSYGDILF